MKYKKLNRTAEFVNAFSDINKSPDNLFCFILGAGASFTSGIPTGAHLAKKWFDEIKEIKEKHSDTKKQFEKWIKEKKIDESNISYHYSDVYEERFKVHPKVGFDELNRLMDKKIPSFGYSVLAQIMASDDKPHNVVITTNFDNLMEDALYTYTQKRPLVCGHEVLASFATPSRLRPLIVKIHRDRFLNPFSKGEQIQQINQLWVQALNEIFRKYIPVVIGYGGNDGSLMGYLKEINKCENFFWCIRKGEIVKPEIEEVLNKQEGWLVEIEGFDELMVQLQDELQLPELTKAVVEDAQKRSDEYNKQRSELIKKITESTSVESETKEAVKKIKASIKKDNPLYYYLAIYSEKDSEAKERLFKEAIKKFPNNEVFYNDYAIYLKDVKKDYVAAEKSYVKAIEINPKHADIYENYALYLDETKKDYAAAEKNYLKAIELNPNEADFYRNYAIYLHEIKKDYEAAEKNYLKAIDLNPYSADAYNNYASLFGVKFHKQNRLEFIDKAIELSLKAHSLDNTKGIYNLACSYALKRDKANALEWLVKAIKIQGKTKEEILLDKDWNGYLQDIDFKALLDKYYPKS